MAHNSLSMYMHVFLVYSLLHCQTIVQILHHFTVTVNNIEVTGNICTCTDVFTIITTKDQSGGIYMYNIIIGLLMLMYGSQWGNLAAVCSS